MLYRVIKGLYSGYISLYISGLYKDNGKEKANYYSMLFRVRGLRFQRNCVASTLLLAALSSCWLGCF